MARPVSDRVLSQLLRQRLEAAGVYRLFVMQLGPDDNHYASALVRAADGNVIECRASARDLEDALVQLFNNLDEAAMRTEIEDDEYAIRGAA